MKKLISFVLVLGLMMTFAACGEETAAPTQNQSVETQAQAPEGAIASVTTGEQTSYVSSVKELEAAVDPSGNSVITLLQEGFRVLQDYMQFIYGLGVIILMIFQPDGILGGGKALYERLCERKKSKTV